MLHLGDSVGLCACSNGLKLNQADEIAALKEILSIYPLFPVESSCLYENGSVFSGTAEERAQALMSLYEDDSIQAIFDVSGGDLANEVLDLLDYDRISRHPKPFWGYSDLTCVLNAIYAKTGQAGYLYQIRNLVGEQGEMQRQNFFHSVLEGQEDLYRIQWEFLQGDCMEGVVVGGNIRCFLKLAGTPYFPDCRGKLLFLESRSGGPDRVTAYLAQLRQMGVFSQISGLLLGTFSQMEKTNQRPAVPELVLAAVKNDALPIAVTRQVGHGPDSQCLVIGKPCTIQKECRRICSCGTR